MKRFALILVVTLLALMLGGVGVVAAENLLDNGDFEATATPRKNHQGWTHEYIYGWRPFAGSVWMEGNHITVVPHPDKPGERVLRMTGVESGYVALRSHHIPLTKDGIYTLSAKALVKELAEPTRFRLYIEYWPADLAAETSANRIKTTQVVANKKGEWLDLEVSDLIPENAVTATIMVLIHTTAKKAPLPAEILVDDIRFVEVK